MATDRLLDLIPESIRPQLIDEIKEYLNQQNNQQQQTPTVDPAIKAIAERRNQKYLTSKK